LTFLVEFLGLLIRELQDLSHKGFIHHCEMQVLKCKIFKILFGADGVPQVVEHLSRKNKALSSNPSTA
jgi:ribosomal protein L10